MVKMVNFILCGVFLTTIKKKEGLYWPENISNTFLSEKQPTEKYVEYNPIYIKNKN